MIDSLKTKYWTVDKSLDNLERHPAIIEAANIIKRNDVIAFPTETVYGLGGNALSDEALAKIFHAKGRPSDNPLIIHIATCSQLGAVVDAIPETAKKLMTAFWPGPLTIVLAKGIGMSDKVTAGLPTIAVRMPDDPIALALIKAANVPIAAPSANRSGKPSPTDATHVRLDLDGKISGIIDGGMTNIGVESTVIECQSNTVTILRPGGITKSQLAKVIPHVSEDAYFITKDHVPKSPGMKYTHYSPKAPIILVSGDAQSIQKIVNEEKQAGNRVGVLTTKENVDSYVADVILACGERQHLSTVGAELYATLRQFDLHEVDLIVSESFPKVGIGEAIMNRLEKAASTHL